MQKRHLSIFLKLLPLLFPFLALVATGLCFTVLQSFGIGMFGYHYSSPFFAYKTVFSEKWFVNSFFFSFYVAIVSALIATALGILFSCWVWSLPIKIRQFAVLQRIFLILPHISVAFIIVILFSRTGVLSSIFYQLHLIQRAEQFPSFVYSGNGLDVIAGYIFKEVPFVMVMVLGILAKLDVRQVETARMLGGNNRMIFFRIILPFIMPVTNTAFLIIFIYSFGAFDLPFVLGGSYPGMISLRVYEYYFQRDLYYRPIAMAILTLLFFFSLFFILLYSRLAERLENDVRKI